MNKEIDQFTEPFYEIIKSKGLIDLKANNIRKIENYYNNSKKCGYEFEMINCAKRTILFDEKGKKFIYSEKGKAIAPIISKNSNPLQPYYITEGETDYSTLLIYTKNVIGILGANNSSCLMKNKEELFKYIPNNAPTFYVCFDNDEAGNKGMKEIINELLLCFPLCKIKTINWFEIDSSLNDIRDGFLNGSLNMDILEKHFSDQPVITCDTYISQTNAKLLLSSKEKIKLPISYSQTLSSLIVAIGNSTIKLLMFLMNEKPILHKQDDFARLYPSIDLIDQADSLLENVDHKVIEEFFHSNNSFDMKDLFDKIVNHYKRLIYFDDIYTYDFIATYTLMTYLYPIFPRIPYLNFSGMRGSGKSQTINVMANLCFNGDAVTQPTLAAMKRTMDAKRGTFCMDDIENLSHQTEDNTVMISMLNTGYAVDAKTKLIDQNKGMKVQDLYFGGPKIIGGINSLEETLASRCIKISMSSANENFRPERVPTYSSPEILEFRAKQLIWSMCNHQKIKNIFDELALTTSPSRENDLSLPLRSIARFYDNLYQCDLELRIVHAIDKSLKELTIQESAESALLKFLLTKLTSSISFEIKSQDICDAIDWEEFGLTKFNTKQTIANILQSNRLILSRKRVADKYGKHTHYQIDAERLRAISKRYRLT